MNKIKIGIDIDGTITDRPDFFALLSQNPNFEVHILTGRDVEYRDSTIDELNAYGIKFHYLHFADDWPDKGRICVENGITVIFDDMDEFIKYIPESITVFKIRNGGNWSTKNLKWD